MLLRSENAMRQLLPPEQMRREILPRTPENVYTDRPARGHAFLLSTLFANGGAYEGGGSTSVTAIAMNIKTFVLLMKSQKLLPQIY